jgi:hypothetical protein
MASQLPQELVLKIFWNKKNNIFDPITVEHALENRQSSTLYLGHFFRNPSELLRRMGMYNAWIIGAFALNYFSDHFQNEVSRIDFIIPHDLKMIVNFMEYMKTIGVKWLPSESEPMFANGLLKYNSNEIRIRLNTGSKGLSEMICGVNSSDISILQCAITGFSTFHMYPNDVYQKKCSMWAFEHDCMFTYMVPEELTKKYQDLGYNMIKGSRYLLNESTLNQARISRSIGDINSEIIRSSRSSGFEHGLHKSLEYEKATLEKYIWYEYPSFLREGSVNHYYASKELMSMQNQMEREFKNHVGKISNELVDTFRDACASFANSMNVDFMPPLNKECIYESIDDDYYDQFEMISLLKRR